MAYYTRLRLKVSPESQYNTIWQAFYEQQDEFDIFEDECRAFYIDEWACGISTDFPEIFIQITGEGEESGDIWTSLYYEGKKVDSWELDYEVPDLVENYKDSNPKIDEKVKVLKELIKENGTVYFYLFNNTGKVILPSSAQISNIKEEYTKIETLDKEYVFRITEYSGEFENDLSYVESKELVEYFQIDNENLYIRKINNYNSWTGVGDLVSLDLIEKKKIQKEVEIEVVL